MILPSEVKTLYLDPIFLNPTFYGAVILILALELAIPAKSRQGPWSIALVQDFIWLLLETALKFLVIATWMRMIGALYVEYLSFLAIDAMYRLPTIARVIVALLVTDLIGWFQHWLRHKVPWFWEFHKIHHAQTELNLFTDARLHIVDWTVSSTLRYLLMLLLGVPPIESASFELIAGWYTRAYHANLRTNLGWLRYIIVSPQFHRVHHSREKAHADTNYAVLFPIWDYLFRTKHPEDDVYPDTGIMDEQFPKETKRFGLGLIKTPLWQFMYPFRAIVTSVVGSLLRFRRKEHS